MPMKNYSALPTCNAVPELRVAALLRATYITVWKHVNEAAQNYVNHS